MRDTDAERKRGEGAKSRFGKKFVKKHGTSAPQAGRSYSLL